MRTPAFGHDVVVTRACPAGVEGARKLVEGDHADVVVAYPDDETGYKLALYAETQSDVTFVDGSSGLPATTLDVQAPNYFRLAPDRRQRAAGLGTYAYRALGRRRMRLAGVSAFARDAFNVEFCSLGGNPGPRERLRVRTRIRYHDAAHVLRVVLRDAGLRGLRDELAQALDDNRQAIVDVQVGRDGRGVAEYEDVEQTFGGVFTEDDEPDRHVGCERYDVLPWSR